MELTEKLTKKELLEEALKLEEINKELTNNLEELQGENARLSVSIKENTNNANRVKRMQEAIDGKDQRINELMKEAEEAKRKTEENIRRDYEHKLEEQEKAFKKVTEAFENKEKQMLEHIEYLTKGLLDFHDTFNSTLKGLQGNLENANKLKSMLEGVYLEKREN